MGYRSLTYGSASQYCRNLVFRVGFLLALSCLAYAQVDISFDTGSTYFDLQRSAKWGTANIGGIENNYIFTPASPDEGVCVGIFNNNTTSAHSVTVKFFQTADVNTFLFTNNTAKWTALFGYTGGGVAVTGTAALQLSVSIPAATLGQFYTRTTGASRVAVSLTGTAAAGGSPETADIYLTQNLSSGVCGTQPMAPSTTTGAASITVQFWSAFLPGAGPTSSPLFPSIGQNQHRAVLHNVNSAGGFIVDFAFQASYDGVNFFEIGSPVLVATQNAAGGGAWASLEADGAYPFVKLVANNNACPTCTFDGWYTGSIFPNPAVSAISPRYAGRGMQQRTDCSTSATVVLAALVVNRFVVVYGWQIEGPSAVTLTLQDTGGTNNKVQCTIAAGGSSCIAGPSPLSMFSTNRGTGVQVTRSAAVSSCATIQYRYEDNPQ